MHGIQWCSDLGEGKRNGLIIREKQKLEKKSQKINVSLIMVDILNIYIYVEGTVEKIYMQ